MIRPARKDDASALCTIYNHYIRETAVTFEESPVPIKEMERRIGEIGAAYPWLVYDDGVYVLGYAYINRWRDRSAYRYSAETTVYVKTGSERKGIGAALYTALLGAARKAGIHALVAGITLPNKASVALHEQFGFKKIARFNEIGFKQNRWLDVGYWELILK
ncbi:MAG: GNAT family N-acetyltransferase [Treponema sp.]|jgi:phosphinothricin acetyltransferase|nr:GNAT family N-acetyltransferase [Treponema sp.]